MGAKDLKSLLELLLKDSHIVQWRSLESRRISLICIDSIFMDKFAHVIHFVQCVHFIWCSKKISKWRDTRACNPCNLNGRSISWRSRVISLCSCWSRVIHVDLWSPADQEWYTHEWSAVPQIKTDHLPTIRSSMISSLKSSVTLVTVLHQGWV